MDGHHHYNCDPLHSKMDGHGHQYCEPLPSGAYPALQDFRSSRRSRRMSSLSSESEPSWQHQQQHHQGCAGQPSQGPPVVTQEQSFQSWRTVVEAAVAASSDEDSWVPNYDSESGRVDDSDRSYSDSNSDYSQGDSSDTDDDEEELRPVVPATLINPKGFCAFHPHVRMQRRKKTLRGDKLEVLLTTCPECCMEALYKRCADAEEEDDSSSCSDSTDCESGSGSSFCVFEGSEGANSYSSGGSCDGDDDFGMSMSVTDILNDRRYITKKSNDTADTASSSVADVRDRRWTGRTSDETVVTASTSNSSSVQSLKVFQLLNGERRNCLPKVEEFVRIKDESKKKKGRGRSLPRVNPLRNKKGGNDSKDEKKKRERSLPRVNPLKKREGRRSKGCEEPRVEKSRRSRDESENEKRSRGRSRSLPRVNPLRRKDKGASGTPRKEDPPASQGVRRRSRSRSLPRVNPLRRKEKGASRTSRGEDPPAAEDAFQRLRSRSRSLPRVNPLRRKERQNSKGAEKDGDDVSRCSRRDRSLPRINPLRRRDSSRTGGASVCSWRSESRTQPHCGGAAPRSRIHSVGETVKNGKKAGTSRLRAGVRRLKDAAAERFDDCSSVF